MNRLTAFGFLAVCAGCVPLPAATYLVISADDSGPGSLRQAIVDANAAPGADLIHFAIGGAGPHTIAPATALPAITDPVTIDGFTQPGSSPNTSAEGNNAVWSVRIDGVNTGGFGNGLWLTGPSNVVRGLTLIRAGTAIRVDSAGNVIAGNLIGLDLGGSVIGGQSFGVDVSGANNLIGGTTPGARNVISGNSSSGINLGNIFTLTATNNRVQGNFIGTDHLGVNARGNGFYGIHVGGPGNLIGGTEPGVRNVISGHTIGRGIHVNGNNTIIQGNFIGTTATGLAPLPNLGEGIMLNSGENTLVGGDTPAARNVISGNLTGGVNINVSVRNQVLGNFIGTDATGLRPLPNTGSGVVIFSSSNQVGAASAATANVIAFNTGAGISVGAGTNNVLRGNSIHANGNIGINLGIALAVNNNDNGDGDGGPNQLQNYPVLTNAVVHPASTLVEGTLNSRPGTLYTLDFYASPEPDATPNGEGQQWLGSADVTTGANSNATFSATLPVTATGRYVSATATDPFGNTSEFSRSLVASATTPGLSFVVTTTADDGAGSLRQAIIDANQLPNSGNDQITFDIPGAGVRTIALRSALPVARDGLTLDGFSQPGAMPNSLPDGNNAVVLIRLDGQQAGAGVNGLTLTNRGNRVRGLEISRFSGSGIEQNGGGEHVFEGNVIVANVLRGIHLNGASNSFVGGLLPGSRNVISGNGSSGVQLVGAAAGGNLLLGNFIGTDRSGTVDQGNGQHGVLLNGGSDNVVGGASAAAGNVISGNDQHGVFVNTGTTVSNTFVLGNRIGTDLTGTLSVPNSGAGVHLQSGTGVAIGLTNVGAANVIAFNTGAGVTVLAGTNNVVRGNRLSSNGGLGLDLVGLVGVNNNDAFDTDIGANWLQNHPVITNAVLAAGSVTIRGRLASRAGTTYQLDFYDNAAADPSGHGEGAFWRGTGEVTTDGAGNATFEFVLPGAPTGRFLSATATDPAGNTSEFGPTFEASSTIPAQTFLVTSTADTGAGTLRQAILANNQVLSGTPNRIHFNLPGSGPRTIAPGTPLPTLTEPAVIDGFTQPGAQADSPAGGWDAVLLVRLDGASLGANADGLRFTGSSNTVRGLVVVRFSGAGLNFLSGRGHLIEQNLLGIDVPAAGSVSTLGRPATAGFRPRLNNQDPVTGNGVGVRLNAANSIFQNNVGGNNGTSLYVNGDANVGRFNLLGSDPGMTYDFGDTVSILAAGGGNNRFEQNHICHAHTAFQVVGPAHAVDLFANEIEQSGTAVEVGANALNLEFGSPDEADWNHVIDCSVGIRIADAAFYVAGAYNAFQNVGAWVERNRPAPSIQSVTSVGNQWQVQVAWDRGFSSGTAQPGRFTVHGQTPDSGGGFIPIASADTTVDTAGHASGSVGVPSTVSRIRVGFGERYTFPVDVAMDSTPFSEEWAAPTTTDLAVSLTRGTGTQHPYRWDILVQNNGPASATGVRVRVVIPTAEAGLLPLPGDGTWQEIEPGLYEWSIGHLPAQGIVQRSIEASPVQPNFMAFARLAAVDQPEGPDINNSDTDIEPGSVAATFGQPFRTGNQLTFGLNGPGGTLHDVEQTEAFAIPTEWRSLGTFSAGSEITLPIDPNLPQSFVRATGQAAHFVGPGVTLQGRLEESDWGENAWVYFDWDRDGTWDQRVQSDDNGRWFLAADATQLDSSGTYHRWYVRADGTRFGDAYALSYTRNSALANPAGVNPVSDASYLAPFCSCNPCPEKVLYAAPGTLSPAVHDVQLASGQLRTAVPLTRFATRGAAAGLGLNFSSLENFAGPWGNCFTFSTDWQVTRFGADQVQVRAPDGIVAAMNRLPDGTWEDVPGLNARLALEEDKKRWQMVFPDGRNFEFFEAPTGQPGRLLGVCDPNGNKFAYHYNTLGSLVRIKTDGGQSIDLTYTEGGRLDTLIDPLGREFQLVHDPQGRLTDILQPETEFADIGAGVLLTDTTFASALVTKSRGQHFAYTDPNFPNQFTSITDERGAVVRSLNLDDEGRVASQTLNGRTTQYLYEPTAGPTPLPKLEPGNLLTRTIDPEGNVVDTEMVGPGQVGQYGIRRRVTWTRTGLGQTALRPGEPLYWEQRWQQSCDCLAPAAIAEPFSSLDLAGLSFDAAGLPNNWPRTSYTYNQFKQVLAEVVAQGAGPLRTEFTYQPSGYGDNLQYARLLTRKEPRGFSGSPLYSGLSFVHHHEYDTRGNRLRHVAPTVTRGQSAPQPVVETWTYDEHGRELTHVDPNGNRTEYAYYDGPVTGGGLNTAGEFGGYLKSITRGAAGSTDPAPQLTTTFKVNALGWPAQIIDPAGRVQDTTYNALGEVVAEFEPEVTLYNGNKVRYETRNVYDGAGNRVLTRRSNVDHRGMVDGVNPWIDRSWSFDAGNLRLAERMEVDGNDANDLITRRAYDGNQQLIVTEQPEGNRIFTTYDERRLRLREFAGVAPGATLLSGYPADKSADTLTGTTFLRDTLDSYDARGNRIRHRDGRGNITDFFFDFANRSIAESDPNGNGWRRTLDELGNPLTEERGVVSKVDGQITLVLSRQYQRIDQLNRPYQVVDDVSLVTPETFAVDPAVGGNPSRLTRFDAGSRVVGTVDANGNATDYAYDAVDRRLSVTDALGNSEVRVYDASSSISSLTETELSGPETETAGANPGKPRKPGGPATKGEPVTYLTQYGYDELRRRTLTRERGRAGGTIDHQTRTAFDSLGRPERVIDAEGNTAITTFDDASRVQRMQWFAGNPDIGGSELQRVERGYDRNSRKTEDRAYGDVANLAGSVQVTRFAYDHLNRIIREVHPDSDDPIAGGGNGPDGSYDRIETQYDANSNPVSVVEQRMVNFANTFDPANRLNGQMIALPPGVPGTDQQQYDYDALNRLTSARNNYARVEREYDVLSRMTAETQSIKLDGTGFNTGWEQPIRIESAYDQQHNRTGTTLKNGSVTELSVSRTFDPLNRVRNISASYFAKPIHSIATYAYAGSARLAAVTLGNGARLDRTYDDKRRIAEHVWEGPAGMLAGFRYSDATGGGYDRVDHPLYEQFLHDGNRYDHLRYNSRYETTGVEFRSVMAAPPGTFGSSFAFNDHFNRTSASFGDPFQAGPNTVDTYTSNAAQEYTQIVRNGVNFSPTHDAAGNVTGFPVRPDTTNPTDPDVLATASWDAFNNLHDLTVAGQPKQDVRNDPFNRPVAAMNLAGGLAGSSRWIYDGWKMVAVREFNAGATPANAPSTLRDLCVQGPGRNEPLVFASDRDHDGLLGWSTSLNERSVQSDQHYYLLNNGRGSVMALLDFSNAGSILEYYRYTVTGERTTLARKDANLDQIEDTPGELEDNLQAGERALTTEHGNPFGHAGTTVFPPNAGGVMFDRGAYVEPRTGQPLQRTPGGVGGNRTVLERFGGALYDAFVGWWLDPIKTFITRYGLGNLLLGLVQGTIAIATSPLEIFEAIFYSFQDMRKDIIEDLAERDLSGWVLDRFYANQEAMDNLRVEDPERYAKIAAHFGSDLHWRYGYFVQWLTGDKITAWEAMNIWYTGGLTGIEDMGSESVLLDNITCAHDAELDLFLYLDAGHGAGFGRGGNLFSGMISTFLRVSFSGDYGLTGFGDAGLPGVERPMGSVPGDKLPRSRTAGFAGWSIIDENYNPLLYEPPGAAAASAVQP